MLSKVFENCQTLSSSMHLSVGMIVLSGEGSSRKSSKDDHQVSGVVGADRYSIASLCLFPLEAFKRKIVLL